MNQHVYRLFLVLCLLFPLTEKLQAQQHRGAGKFWIFFTDKKGVSEFVPVRPEARTRRALRGRTASPDLDRPLSPEYLRTLRQHGIEPVVQSRWLNAVTAYLTPEQRALVQTLPFVRRVRPVARFVQKPLPFSTLPSMKAHDDVYGPSAFQLAFINAIKPLENGYRGKGIRIGFLDTAFWLSHPALIHLSETGRLIGTYDFVYDREDVSEGHPHGTMTSSTTLGYDEGSLIGPAHQGALLAAHTEYAPAEINQEEDWFVAGMEWMEQMGADIVNVSLGYSVFDEGQRSYTYEDMDGDTAIPTIAADKAAQLGIVVVVSAGNEGGCGSPAYCWYYITSPADGDSVITVGAVRPDSTLAPFSSRGPTADGRIKPDVVALGVGVYVAYPPDQYIYASGTSFSAPLTTGVVAQMLQANPSLSPVEVRDILRATASQASSPDNMMGWGIINADAAVREAIARLKLPENASPRLQRIYPNPASQNVTIAIAAPRSTPSITVELYNALGQRVRSWTWTDLYPGINQRTFSVAALASGVYFIRLMGTEQPVWGKMVVQHF